MNVSQPFFYYTLKDSEMPYYLTSIIAFESESERSRILELLSENGYNAEEKKLLR